MTHPQPGQQPGPQQYPGLQQYPGSPPHPYPGQPPYPSQPPYPGQAYPGPPRPPGKAMPVVAGLLYLPGVLLALVGSFGLASRSGFAFDLWGAILVPPFPGGYGSFAVASAVSFVLPVSALVLAVLLMCRVPGVRWGLVAISVPAAVHFALLLADIASNLPPSTGFMPAIALLLWLVAALPPVGRAMRGAKPKTPPVRGRWA
ncbi:hypothetical protein LZG04_31410 [Saccharothrix sp. S26]|uniref:hypothetical protein n=1 Tax=Saccharothrix sp. S26 TaxID=2907215 RepID=UPI001F326E85|nr:hypothetical protein [Saccharothrix sp. S26]MCE6999282.1 hypothetical protein [Saccharothrix sp. S26]